jgi:Pregnancy-associated plasma protein-A
MRRFSLAAAFGIMLFAACNKTKSTEQPIVPEKEAENTTVARACAAYDVLEEQLRRDPSLQQRMDAIEEFTARYEQNPAAFRLVGNDLEVPVVVNVLYSNAAQNVSDAQIQSQLDVLNADFGGTNADLNLTSTYNSVKFTSGSSLPKIRFVRVNTVRKSTTTTSWGTNDAMKRSSSGGIDPTSPSTTLNIWVCNLGGGILGYAQFPGGSLSTDGVVCDDNAFGTTGTASAPFNKGRTATHEVGHYFNLRHIWGDKRCGNDQVGDTPGHTGANYGCPAAGIRSSCSGRPVMMTMNYMDYTDDACMYMFSIGQVNRMNATWAVGGPRASLR